ncbi:heterokaryon incompatibility protein-domain-containing protein [Cercophora newfieldiana]|uniref:Heterokaryon incompatibility protein-domain-containing protein n=1 Tax=Cercophora newfieldiana TaxID=92897 RepID=A0AA39YI92_9PEZI|nr:heterokaryon incompatibility protein-domain-containing protein [Cercophora newfieldiana]
MDLRLHPRRTNPSSVSSSSSEVDSEPAQTPTRFRQPAKLCPKCQFLIDDLGNRYSMDKFGDSEDDGYHIRHHETLSAIKQSAEDGCSLCTHFVSSTPIKWGSLPPEADGSPVWAKLEPLNNFETVNLRIMGPDIDELIKDFIKLPVSRVAILHKAPSQAEDYDSPEGQTSTKDALPLCRRWLQTCRLSHTVCNGDGEFGHYVPTRLIDLESPTPRIRLAAELVGNDELEYATLSHCWGTLKFTTLKTTNLETFRCGLPTHELPKTFLDAIHIAQSLGFRYLWIDSLCILQDSIEDWDTESSLMTKVYGRSSLNIAATSAANGSVGCFFERNRDWRCQISTSNQDAWWDISKRLVWDEPGQLNELARRAWVVQERYLSRRTLHFDDQQVSWECDEGPACEFYPSGYTKQVEHFCAYRLKKRPLTEQLWPRIVEIYSRGELTRPTDKLVAIGGLARLIQEKTGDDYIAGLWRRDLEHQLLWRSDNRDGGGHVRLDTGTPTWSWASIQGRIEFFSTVDEIWVSVHDVHLTHSSPNPFGGVSDANLRLICQYFHLATLKHRTTGYGYDIRFDGESSWTENGAYIWFDTDEGAKKAAEDGPISLFLLAVEYSKSWDICEGLLLEPTGFSKGEYRRVGYWKMHKAGGIVTTGSGAVGRNLVTHKSYEHFAGITSEGETEQFFIDLV